MPDEVQPEDSIDQDTGAQASAFCKSRKTLSNPQGGKRNRARCRCLFRHSAKEERARLASAGPRAELKVR